MSLSTSLNLGADTLILGQGDQDVNLVSKNGRDIKINGIVPTDSGGGGVPPIGDVSFVGNLIVNDNIDNLGNKGNIIFGGQDIYHSTPQVPGQPVVDDISYVTFKQLAEKNENQLFTGQNDFAERVRIQLSDGAPIPTYTDKIILNKSGNIQCVDINNDTQITTGTITCDNGGDNECKARIFNTRTSGTNGWNIKQALEEAAAPGNAGNNILQIAATQAQAAGIPVEVYITSSEYDPSNGDNPNIKLIPSTVLNGGRIQAAQFDLGTASGRYYLKQDIGGPLNNVLQIKAPTASAEVRFQDNLGGDTLTIKNTSVDLKNDIALNFNLFSFRPQQYTFNFTGAVIDDNPPTALFRSHTSLWTNENDGGTSTLATIGNNFFKMTIIGVPDNSAGVYGNFRWSGDFPFLIPNFSTGTVINRFDGNFGIITSPSGFTKPDLCGFSSGSTDYKLCFPSVAAGTDTFSGTIRITILNT